MARTRCVLLAVLLAVAMPAGVASTAGTTPTAGGATPTAEAATYDQPAAAVHSPGSGATAQSEADVVVTHEYRLLPDEPGYVEATTTVQAPSSADQINALITHDGVEVVDTDGFEPDGDGSYVSDGTTNAPSVTVRIPVSTDPEDPWRDIYGTDEWALVAPTWMVAYVPFADYEYARNVTVDGEGVAGRDVAFLGPHEIHQATAGSERLRLVVPEGTQVSAGPDAVLAQLSRASGRLRVGNRYGTFTGFVAPETIEGPGTGENFGDDAIYYGDFPVEGQESVWIEHYADGRLGRLSNTDDTALWLDQATAAYYGALVPLHEHRRSYGSFRSQLAPTAGDGFGSVVLADPSTWALEGTGRTKGMLVVAAIDRRIREATDGEATFQDVVRAWNDHDGTWNQTDLLDAVEAAAGGGEAGADVRAYARELITTSRVPETWDRETHSEVYDVGLPHLNASLANDGRLRVEGPYREGPVTGPVLVGEHVVAEVVVSNDGSAADTYEAALVRESRSSEAVLDDASVAVEPGQRRTVTLRTRPREPGQYDLRVAGESVTLEVVEPATPNVTALEVSPEDPRPGDDVTVTATLETDAPLALGELAVAGNATGANATGANETAVVATGETRNVSVTLDGVRAGTLAISVGDRTRSVDVAEPSGLAALPGFGPIAALLALASVVGWLARPRTSS